MEVGEISHLWLRSKTATEPNQDEEEEEEEEVDVEDKKHGE